MKTPVSSDHIYRCEKILHLLGKATSGENREGDCTFVQKAKYCSVLNNTLFSVKITVAVYGDTGAGKSSLLNALLDQPSLLPTAGMGRACTSVIIKIEENKTSSDFEADIEFLTAEDWNKDLNALRCDLRWNDGDNDEDNDGGDDEDTDVYGPFEDTNLDTMLDDDTVTAELLGAVKKLLDSSARKLRDKISTYSETTDDDCQFWPIVKQVVLKVPDSGLCQSGVNLVDLPGVRDSNAARADVARKYMQTCDVLLVVTKIQRAVDNKTVMHTLGDKLFCQPLMNHTKTAVVCTHTDDVKPSEVIRKLKLPQAAEWKVEGQRYKEEEQVLQQKLADVNCRSASQENSLIQQQQDLHAAMLKRERTSMCAVERNKFVRNKILHAISSPPTPHDQDYPRDLEVFCVSSSDYINLSKLLTCEDDDDNKPSVFLSKEDTEIPALRIYLQEVVWEKQKKHRMSLQNDFQAIINDIRMYLINSKRGKKALKEELERHLDTLRDEGRLILEELDSHLQLSWIAVMDATLDEATQEAIRQAKPRVESWARPVNTGQRRLGGLAYKTYKATVCRMGIFTSTWIGCVINMNQDLADPFVKILSKELTPRFSEQEWTEIVKSKIKEPASIAITRFTKAIMESLGDSDATLLKDLTQLKTDTLGKLTRLDSLWEKTIKRQQREITHMIPDFIQEQMQSAYVPCSEQGGHGAFNRMKHIMATTIDQLKNNMFEQLKEKIKVSLGALKNGFMRAAKKILEDIVEDTKKQIMPLSQTPDEAMYLETLEKSEGLIQTLSEDFANYKMVCMKQSEESHKSGPE